MVIFLCSCGVFFVLLWWYFGCGGGVFVVFVVFCYDCDIFYYNYDFLLE